MEKGISGILHMVAKTGGIRLDGNDVWFNPSDKLKDGLKEDTITEWKAKRGEQVILDIDSDGKFSDLKFVFIEEEVLDHIEEGVSTGASHSEEKLKDNYFTDLIKIKCTTTKKMNLTYVSWADAWIELKKRHPLAMYHVCEFEGKPYLVDASGGYVKVSVSIPIKDEGDDNYCQDHCLPSYT